MDADTVNRELSIARKAIGWWQRQGWTDGNPTIGIVRRPAPPDRTKALAENQIAALWRLDVALREKMFGSCSTSRRRGPMRPCA
jgi:integrase/recombinase XerD